MREVHITISVLVLSLVFCIVFFFFFQAEDGIRDYKVTGFQTCALPIYELPECLPIGLSIRPIGEIRNEVLTDLPSGVLAGIGVEAFPVAYAIESKQTDGKKDAPAFTRFASARLGDFGLHPFAMEARFGQDEEHPVMGAYRLVDLLVQLAAAANIVRREPAGDARSLQIGMEPRGTSFIGGGIADKNLVLFHGSLRRRAICLRVVGERGPEIGVVLERMRRCGKIGGEVDDEIGHSGPIKRDLEPFLLAVEQDVALDQTTATEGEVDG